MALEQLLAAERYDYETILDNVELMTEDQQSPLYQVQDTRQRIIQVLLDCASDNDHLNLLRRVYDFFLLLKTVNLLSVDESYHKLRVGFMYKRTTLQNKKKDIMTSFLQFVDYNEQQPLPLHTLLDPQLPEDAAFIDVLKQYVAEQSEEFQVRYLSLAPPSLLDSLKIPGQLLAERLTFLPGARQKFTMMVIGKTGQGKSCLVNELHKLPEDERCKEFAGKSTGTIKLDSKVVMYKRPYKPEEIPPKEQTATDEQTTSTNTTEPTSPNSTDSEKEKLLETDTNASEQTIGEMEVAIEIVDTPGIEAKSERQELVQGEIFERLSEGFVEGGSPINVILHCLNPSVPRLDDIEHEWIRALSGYAPVILVYTHALTSPEDIKEWIANLNPPLPIVTDVQVLARDEETGMKKKTIIKRFGLVELVEALVDVYPISLAKIDEHIQNSNDTSEEQLQAKMRKAYSIVAGAAAGGGVSGALPVPGADIAATIAVQGFMLAGINRLYGIPYDKNLLATLGSQLVWSAPAALLSRAALAVIASSLKIIPFVDIAASFVNAGLGIFFTTALGMAYVRALDRLVRTRGSLIGLPRAERQRLIEEMFREEAKKVAAEDMKNIKQKLEEETKS